MTSERVTCGDAGGIKTDGMPCGSKLNLSPENGRCLFHDESRAAEARETSQAGGRASAVAKRARRTADPDDVPAPPKTLEDAVRWSSWAMHAVACGRIDARTGHEIGYLVNAFKAAVEKRDLERQIQELRAELAAAQKRPGRLAVG